MRKLFFNILIISAIVDITSQRLLAQNNSDDLKSLKTVPVKHFIFSKTDQDASIWSAMYIASNNKIYIGLCTHADAANVYEFDIGTNTMKHLANLTILLGERGRAIWTNGKIHVRMQELDGYVYFGSFCEDNGPPAIDANSYEGPRWFRISMVNGKVEPLSKINSFWGLVGQTMDKQRRIIYGLDELGHLWRYYIDEDYTEDMGRVDNWDICRTLFIDETGNVYGSYPPGRIWKYDVVKDRIFDLEYVRLPITIDARSMANPMLDRRAQWRYIEWDPVDKVAYGIIGGNNLLFKFDVNNGPEGTITPLVMMCPPSYRDGKPFDIPHAMLAMTINHKNRKIYYIPVTEGDFDYGLINPGASSGKKDSGKMVDRPKSGSYLLSYDLKTRERTDLGILKPTDGSLAIGMGAAETDKDGKVWFVGSFYQPEETLKINGGFQSAMGLGCYDPFAR